MKLKQRLVGGFTTKGKTITYEGETFRPGVRVDIGSGIVTDIKLMSNDNSQITVEVQNAKFPLSGYLGTGDPIFKIFEEAMERKEPIAIRIERKHKSGIDPRLDIEDITVDMATAQKHIVKIVAGVYDAKNEQWLLSDQAESTPSEDPVDIQETMKTLSYSADAIDGFFDKPAQAAIPQVAAHTNDKANVLLTFFFFIKECENKYGYELPTKGRLKAAQYLSQLVDQLQMTVFQMEQPNYRDYTHTKARSLLFNWEEHFVNFDKEAAMQLQSWGEKFLSSSVELWRTTLQMSSPKVASDK